MLREMAPERATATPPDHQPSATGLVAAAAAVRGALVAIAGVLLTAGLALMVWAITPASGPDAMVAMRGGVTAFALANLMPVDIGGATLSLPPLLLTALPVTLLLLTARRGRFLPVGAYQESIAVLTTAGVYGLVVAATTRGYSTPGAVPAGSVWTAFALALAATALGMLRGDSAWRRWAAAAMPEWARSGLRGALVGTAALVGAGALVLSCGLILRFGTAVDIAAAAAPSWLDGLGMTLLGLAYLPNAIVAAVGFVSGVGFEIGPGTYSPLATSTVDLPGVPLLAAAPQHAGRTMLGLACLVIPLAVGYLVARPAVRRLVTRADRVGAAALAGVLTGAALALAAVVASGGVGDGRWSTMGVPAWLLGPAIALEVGGVACVVAAVTGWRTVPWRIRDLTVGSETVPVGDADPEAAPRRATRRTKRADTDPETRQRRSTRRTKRAAGEAETGRARSRRPRRTAAAETKAQPAPVSPDPTQDDPDPSTGDDKAPSPAADASAVTAEPTARAERTAGAERAEPADSDDHPETPDDAAR